MFTRQQAEAHVLTMADWFGSDPEDGTFRAAVLRLLGIGRRKHLNDMTKVSGYPREFVKQCLAYLRAGRIWKGEDKLTYANWCDNDLAFVLDVMVAHGTLVKTYKP